MLWSRCVQSLGRSTFLLYLEYGERNGSQILRSEIDRLAGVMFKDSLWELVVFNSYVSLPHF